MARTYKRDSNGRFAGGGGSSGGGGKRPAAKSVSRGVNRLTRDNAGKITSVGGSGATARGGRLKTAAGNKRATVTAKASGGSPAGTMKGKIKRDPGAAGKVGQQAKPVSRKEQLAAGAKKRNAQADRIDAKVKKLEGEYRSKDAAFYTQGVKPAGRDRMIAKSQQAAQLREQSAAFRSKAANAEKMASKIKDKPVKSSGGNARLERAIKNEAAGSTSYRRNPKGYSKRIAALEAQKIYKTGDVLASVTIRQMTGKGFRLPRDQRTPAYNAAKAAANAPKTTKAAPKNTARPLSPRETQNLGLAKSNLAISKERLAGARKAKAQAKGPLEKLKATDRINEQQANIRQINNKITRINARPAPGRPITGADRSGNRKQLSAPKKSGAIKGSIKRDASAPSNVKNKSALNAGKYKNIYMANANKAAAAKRKRKP
jgi:hypothetical protein